MFKKVLVTAALLALPLSVAHASDDVPDGKKIYQNNCASCHGMDGTVSKFGKDLKPFPARNHRAMAQVVSRDEMRRIITYGVRGTGMRAKKYDLDPLEIEAVIDYIKTFDYKPNLANGKKRFEQVCSSCHAMNGRGGTGLGAANLVYSKLNLKEIVHTLRHGRSGTMMTANEHQLSNPDINDVAHYVLSLRYQANLGNGKKLYAKHCQSCHSSPSKIKLIGNAARQIKLADLSDQLLDLRIRHGRHVKRAGKDVEKLSSDEIRDLMAYIRKQ
ncbi:MAG: c-type cytochrome [Mariprofundaceae bacterium]|nr:c-type cytochrome [Mariprofundaceae bacterium]